MSIWGSHLLVLKGRGKRQESNPGFCQQNTYLSLSLNVDEVQCFTVFICYFVSLKMITWNIIYIVLYYVILCCVMLYYITICYVIYVYVYIQMWARDMASEKTHIFLFFFKLLLLFSLGTIPSPATWLYTKKLHLAVLVEPYAVLGIGLLQIEPGTAACRQISCMLYNSFL